MLSHRCSLTATLLAASGTILPIAGLHAGERRLDKEVIVDASIEQVWGAWTTSEGLARFFSPDSKIELQQGGAYELYMGMKEPDESGRRGSEGCKLLSFIPHEMLSFEWSFPPKVPALRNADARTFVVLRFEKLPEGKIRVRFSQLGWQEGRDWDEGYAYFDQAWSRVMNQLKEKVTRSSSGSSQSAESRPAQPRDQTSEGRTWTSGRVQISVPAHGPKRQDFEMVLPVPVQVVWDALATTDGLKQLGGKDPQVELKPGGAYAFWPGANNRVLSYVPGEMLSTSGSAPPEFPNVRKGGTWSAYFFEPLEGGTSTRLRLSVVGWQQGEEWDKAFEYFLKNNPAFLNSVYDKLAGSRPTDKSGALRHEALIDAPLAEVWKAFTTREGLESWMVAQADMDLRIGGKMVTHYDPGGTLGDPNSIENTILSFEPQRMLSIKATRPPEKFPLKEAIKDMWSVIYFEGVESDRTRVVVVGMGFTDDGDSQKLREHFDKGNAWTLQKLKEKFAKPQLSAPSAPASAEFKPPGASPDDDSG